ncbi:IS200/IS605 family transposase [Leptospira sp. GIMC2001]|uniref:IS200/IS605 family transposase n=1 Tax=Leptospira sp. GIMC2001 TaxID=1513297 RepID=UPI00234A4AC7|nr:IS200/IS605 family transposase [Leptospira sp. GIMC2001]WCL49779.1 IS200/IS605 family transposase [Leptospira sp. GIMC2001]
MKPLKINSLTTSRSGAQTNFQNTYHLVFSTRYREKTLDPITKIKIRNLIRQKEEELKFFIYILNGYQDHIHILISIPNHFSISKIMQHIKGFSARQLNRGRFWQDGYYSRPISENELKTVYSYIRNQHFHHRNLANKNSIIDELEIIRSKKFVREVRKVG